MQAEHSRSEEHLDGLRIQSVSGPLQLDAFEASVPQNQKKVGKDEHRSICSMTQAPDQEVLQLLSGSRSNSSGRFLTGLELSPSICIPTISACGKNPAEDPMQASKESSSDSTSMAKTAMVSVAIGDQQIYLPQSKNLLQNPLN